MSMQLAPTPHMRQHTWWQAPHLALLSTFCHPPSCIIASPSLRLHHPYLDHHRTAVLVACNASTVVYFSSLLHQLNIHIKHSHCQLLLAAADVAPAWTAVLTTLWWWPSSGLSHAESAQCSCMHTILTEQRCPSLGERKQRGNKRGRLGERVLRGKEEQESQQVCERDNEWGSANERERENMSARERYNETVRETSSSAESDTHTHTQLTR